MKKTLLIAILLTVPFVYGCSSNNSSSDYSNTYQETHQNYDSYDDGYEWAENNDIDNFDSCQYQFGTSDAENGCNEYVKENYEGYDTFGGYGCTEGCEGHEAGYSRAEENGIDDIDDCGGNSQSFIEGCITYVEENE